LIFHILFEKNLQLKIWDNCILVNLVLSIKFEYYIFRVKTNAGDEKDVNYIDKKL